MGIILSGGPSSVYASEAPRLPPYLLQLNKPILGICYGMQLLAHELHGEVAPASRREYGPAQLSITDPPSALFRNLPSELTVWMSHGDRVAACPPGFRVLASTATTPIAACGQDERQLYGLQFHPEVVHTPQGTEILRNYLFHVCGCHGTWQPGSFVTSTIAEIAQRVGSSQAICALSGGVDSTVAATLVHRAIGDRLICIFVDHGLLRKNEARDNLETFRKHLGLRVICAEAQERFLGSLKGISDPEQKRRIIGREFVRVFEEEAHKLGDVAYLVQGTLYPDVIESNAADTQTAARIKTHHNVGGLPEDMHFQLIEPLRYLFKDEVRRVGKELGLPDEIVYRQPFPGPGLAVRIIGEVNRERLDCLRAADAIVTSEIASAGLSSRVWQYFAVLTPIQTVGVMGDGRTYAHVVAVRAVVSEDGMTADWARLPDDVLARISSRLVNEVPGVNRVVYDVTSKPPATIEWE
jgi:GMP synthase (glutamine-hydrolysing)